MHYKVIRLRRFCTDGLHKIRIISTVYPPFSSEIKSVFSILMHRQALWLFPNKKSFNQVHVGTGHTTNDTKIKDKIRQLYIFTPCIIIFCVLTDGTKVFSVCVLDGSSVFRPLTLVPKRRSTISRKSSAPLFPALYLYTRVHSLRNLL